MRSKQPTSIAYVTQSFPTLTQTFVYRETLALEDRGFDILTMAIWKPDKDQLSQESRHLVDRSAYVFPISWLKFVGAHLHFLLTHPARYMGTLLFVLSSGPLHTTSAAAGWRTSSCVAMHCSLHPFATPGPPRAACTCLTVTGSTSGATQCTADRRRLWYRGP